MKNDRKSGRLFPLLARSYLLFTLVLLLIAGFVYLLWSARLDSVYAESDWDALAADARLISGDYGALSRYLAGDGALAIVDPEGRTLYCSDGCPAVSLTAGELSCVRRYSDSSYISAVETEENGAVRYLVARTAADAEGTAPGDSMLLDGDYRVLSGGLGDGRTSYTESEYEYLTGKKPEGYDLSRCDFTSGDGRALTALFFTRLRSAGEYQTAYEASWRVWLLFLPLYICAAGFFIVWLDRRMRRPLDALNTAVVARSEGRRVSAAGRGGPEEIRRIAESFDRLSDQLETSEAERRRLDEGRQKLIADISHDLRTPVTVISGCADAICDGKVPPEEQPHYLRVIRQKAAELSALISEFHEYSKTAHPDFTLHPVRTDLCEFSREYLADKYDEVELAGFALRVNIPEAPAFCLLDSFQFRRVLDNLLSNSLRHNRLGTVLYYDVCPGDGLVRLAVADNGIGISPEKAADIFEPFVVGDDARSGGGSGLGLAITRQLVEKHGGTIELSVPPPAGRSTQFLITLPLTK